MLCIGIYIEVSVIGDKYFLNVVTLCSSQCIPRPTPPRGSLGVTTGFTWGFAVCSSHWGVGVFSSFAPRLESRDLSILKIIDYSSHCYKIQVLILQNIKAVMFKFSGGVDMRQSYVQGDRMFKMIVGQGGEGRQQC